MTAKQLKAEQKLLEAAMDFYRAEAHLTAMRRASKRCEECAPSTYDEPGAPKCDIHGEEEYMCEACLNRKKAAPIFGTGQKARRRAKARLLRWAAKLATTGTPEARGKA